MMDYHVQVRQVFAGHWEWRVLHPNGEVARTSTEVYRSEAEARAGAERSLSTLSHSTGWDS